MTTKNNDNYIDRHESYLRSQSLGSYNKLASNKSHKQSQPASQLYSINEKVHIIPLKINGVVKEYDPAKNLYLVTYFNRKSKRLKNYFSPDQLGLLANIHKGEYIISKDLHEKLKESVNNLPEIKIINAENESKTIQKSIVIDTKELSSGFVAPMKSTNLYPQEYVDQLQEQIENYKTLYNEYKNLYKEMKAKYE